MADESLTALNIFEKYRQITVSAVLVQQNEKVRYTNKYSLVKIKHTALKSV